MYVKVVSPLRHNGECYKPGDVIDMDVKQAKTLITDGIAEKTAKPAKASKTDKTDQSADSSSEASSANDQESTDDEPDESTGAE